MKYLKKFENNSSYEEYILSEDFISPNVSYVVEDSKVYYNNSRENDYSDYVKLVYFTTADSNSQPTDLFTTFEIEGKKAFDVANNVSELIVEDKAITPTHQYTFSNVGYNIVYVKFVDMTKVPMGAFLGCYQIVGITIPDSIVTIEKYAFDIYSKNFSNDGFEKFLSLFSSEEELYFLLLNTTEEIFTINMSTNHFLQHYKIDFYSIFNEVGWKDFNDLLVYILWKLKPTDAILENGIYYSVDGKIAFFAEKNLIGKVIIKEGVEVVGPTTFVGCSEITEIVFPKTTKTLLGNLFNGTLKLNSIVSFATEEPYNQMNVFYNAPENGILYVPKGSIDSYYSDWMAGSSHGGDYQTLRSKGWTIQELAE